jgi:hypothetical protein
MVNLKQNSGIQASGKDRGSLAHRDAELRGGRPRTSAESLTQPPSTTIKS